MSQLKVDTAEESPVTLVSQCTERNAHSSTITGINNNMGVTFGIATIVPVVVIVWYCYSQECSS